MHCPMHCPLRRECEGESAGRREHGGARPAGRRWLFQSVALFTAGAPPTQHGPQPDTMALITSDCGAMCSPNIEWPLSPRVVRPADH